MVSPALTTVRQPLADMGSTAATMLLQLINGGRPPAMHIQLAAELVVRESTAAPAHAAWTQVTQRSRPRCARPSTWQHGTSFIAHYSVPSRPC